MNFTAVEEESMDARDLKYDDFYGGDEDGSKSKVVSHLWVY